MAEDTQETLTQLGRQAEIPASPEAAMLETVANPRAGTRYLVRDRKSVV